jgi:hypothetical protein
MLGLVRELAIVGKDEFPRPPNVPDLTTNNNITLHDDRGDSLHDDRGDY